LSHGNHDGISEGQGNRGDPDVILANRSADLFQLSSWAELLLLINQA